jgi:hypothetical protein
MLSDDRLLDRMQNSTVEKPKLFVTGLPNMLMVLIKAKDVAEQYGMDFRTIHKEYQAAVDTGQHQEVLKKYFEVI